MARMGAIVVIAHTFICRSLSQNVIILARRRFHDLLDAEMRLSLDEHIDTFIQNLPKMKSKYVLGIQGGPEVPSNTIMHDMGHQYLPVFTKRYSRMPTTQELEEILSLLRNRYPDIVSAVESLRW